MATDLVFENNITAYNLTEIQVLNSVLSVLPQIIFVIDVKKDTIIMVNDKITEILGFQKNEVVGNPDFILDNLANEEDKKTYIKLKQFSYEQNADDTYTTFINLKDKQQKVHHFKIQNRILKKDENTNEFLRLGIAEDITKNISKFNKEILDTNNKLTSKFQVLNRSNKELEQFAYTASHDLQEPLRKIISFGERLEMKYKNQLQEDGKMYLDRMKDAASRMKILIDDLLEYSRISNYHKDEEWINLNETIEEILSDLEIKIQDKNAQIEVEILPQISASKHLMKQLFMNLISNALKFSRKDDQLYIHIKAVYASDEEKLERHLDLQKTYHKIVVSDNGIGFEQEFSEKIFVIFQRLHGRNSYEGTGIGLAICKKIIEQLYGAIHAESKPNEGAVFSLYFPIEN